MFTDGSFVYVPKGVRCPMELSTYFRINAAKTGQFERTLIIADEAPRRATSRAACPAWEEVSYGDEMRCVRDVALHDVVLNDRGEEAEVARIMRRAYRGDMVEITPRSPGKPLPRDARAPGARDPPRARAQVACADPVAGRTLIGNASMPQTPEFVPAGRARAR